MAFVPFLGMRRWMPEGGPQGLRHRSKNSRLYNKIRALRHNYFE